MPLQMQQIPKYLLRNRILMIPVLQMSSVFLKSPSHLTTILYCPVSNVTNVKSSKIGQFDRIIFNMCND